MTSEDSLIILNLVKDLNGLMMKSRVEIQSEELKSQLRTIDWKVNELFTTLVVEALTKKS